ncbi:MAG: CBS domain-containing protein [Theionarchaea archaeon]|nr:CBS domain-containing protein [Theionarchaea archaeon]
MQENEIRSWKTPEFCLVVVMLFVLTVLVFLVLWMPMGTASAEDVLEYRRNILTIIITAFGAWVGAGAAYFFGHENLRAATTNILRMQELSTRERLHLTIIREIPPRVIDWKVKTDRKVEEVLERLREKHDRWFLPIVGEDGTLETVLHEEAVWRYAIEKKNSYKQDDISKVLDFVKENPELGGLKDISVKVTMNDSVAHANELMQNRNVCLALVVDEKEKPTHYVTTGDVRRVLLQG